MLEQEHAIQQDQMLADSLAAQKFTRKYFVVELDFSRASVLELESQFDAVRYALRGGANSENIAQLRQLWGAYLGEVLRRLGGGQWQVQAGSVEPMVTVDKGRFYPHLQIQARFDLGPQASLVSWLERALGERPETGH